MSSGAFAGLCPRFFNSTFSCMQVIKWLCLLGVLAGTAALNGCASVPREFVLNVENVPPTVWPSPPETPRYRYVGQLTGEQNYRVTGGGGLATAGTKLWRWVAGLGAAEREPLVLQRPQAGMVGADGRILVTDVSRAAVYVFDQRGIAPQVWEWAQTTTRFVAPIGIAPGPAGEIWVADAELAYIARLDAQGQPLGLVGKGELQRPTGLAWDAARQRMYVSDTRAHLIKVFDAQGRVVQTFGTFGAGDGQLNAPTHLALRGDVLYVSDTFNARIALWRHDGTYLKSFGRRGLFVGNLPRPKGVAVDGSGRVYVVESYYDYLLVFNAEGEYLLPIGGSGTAAGNFFLPAGAWTDQAQRIYVADMANGRVVILEAVSAL